MKFTVKILTEAGDIVTVFTLFHIFTSLCSNLHTAWMMSLHRTSEGREISEFFFHCSLLQEPTNTCDCCVTEHLLCAFTLKTKDRYYKICFYLLTWITSTGSEQMQVCACPNETPFLIPLKTYSVAQIHSLVWRRWKVERENSPPLLETMRLSSSCQQLSPEKEVIQYDS